MKKAANVTVPEVPVLDTEIVNGEIPPPPKEEKKKPKTLLEGISEKLGESCQHCMQWEIASYVEDAITGNAPLAPLHFSGYAGLGKTHAFEQIAEILSHYGWEAVRLPVGCQPSVFNKMLVDNCSRGSTEKVLFFIDEIHALPKFTKNLLKIATETGGRSKTYTVPIAREEFDVTIDPRRHWFISASNESVKDSALVGGSGRFRDCQFKPYDREGKERIFSALLPIYGLTDVKLNKSTAKIAVDNVRPFARSIASLIKALRVSVRMRGRDLTDGKQMALALRENGYYPQGWTQQHIAILTFLSHSPQGRQVQEIAMGPLQGVDRDICRGLIDELMQGGMIITNSLGRKQWTKEASELLKSFQKAA